MFYSQPCRCRVAPAGLLIVFASRTSTLQRHPMHYTIYCHVRPYSSTAQQCFCALKSSPLFALPPSCSRQRALQTLGHHLIGRPRCVCLFLTRFVSAVSLNKPGLSHGTAVSFGVLQLIANPQSRTRLACSSLFHSARPLSVFRESRSTA